MIPWILQTETSKHCLLKVKLGKLGEGVCGRGEGWSCVLGHSRFFFFSFCFRIFHCLCTSVPYKRRKLSPWCPPGSTKGLRNACNSNTQPNNQKEYSNHAFALKTWDMCNVYCILNKQKSPLTSDITGGAAIWWKKKLGHVPHHNLLPSLPVLLMLLICFLSLFVHSDSLDLHECLAVHTDPARTLNYAHELRGDVQTSISRRVQRNTQYCVCAISDNNTYTKLLRVPNKWKSIEQEGAEMVWTGRDLEKRTNRNWQIFCSIVAF